MRTPEAAEGCKVQVRHARKSDHRQQGRTKPGETVLRVHQSQVQLLSVRAGVD